MFGLTALLAVTESPNAAAALTVREFEWPESPAGWMLLIVGSVVVAGWVAWMYRRDTRDLPMIARFSLTLLRLAVLGLLLVIALNPQERTQKTGFKPSQVAILVDTSLSMRHPAHSPNPELPDVALESRTAAVKKLLADSKLLETLRQNHEVSLYTFDSGLVGPVRVLRSHSPAQGATGSDSPEIGKPPKEAIVDWDELLRPRGLETRLGESLNDLVRQLASKTLSGIVVIGDGASNAGIEPDTAHDRAIASKTRLITVGTGSIDPPVNLQIVDVQSPTEVQVGDPFDITAFIAGQGLNGKTVEVELLVQPEGDDSEPTSVEKQELQIAEENVPQEIKFNRKPTSAGGSRYTLVVKTVQKVVEINDQDNRHVFKVNVFDRPTRVLLMAGGPMRDYQFVRNLLHRHKGTELDVYLQTASVGTSQESKQLLLDFPSTREQLYNYDVVIAFDPDWRVLKKEQIQMLHDWVFQEAGGLILVAGDVNTLQLASLSEQPTASTDDLQPIRELYPVFLNSHLVELRFDQDSSQAWPLAFQSEGKNAGFLQLTDDPVTSANRWKEFPGFYRCYPTSGPKAGAIVYAKFSDPRTQYPILMASQFFGQGRTFYLGSAEMWRLRAVSDEDYDRFWIKSLREMASGRLKRGTRRGLLLPEAKRVALGQTVRVRTRLLDAQFQPLEAESVALELFDPTGKPLIPNRSLLKDVSRAGEFVGDFRASLPGVYRLEVGVPESKDRLTEEVTVTLPRLEDENIRQDAKLLSDLARDTGGQYLRLDEVVEKLPALLPNRGEPFVVDQRLKSLWDRDWMMYLLVGLLSLEWLIRKLLKLA